MGIKKIVLIININVLTVKWYKLAPKKVVSIKLTWENVVPTEKRPLILSNLL